MYIVEFLKRIFKKNNIGIIIYLILNLFVVVSFISILIPKSLILGILLGIVVYIISISIALSPFGEAILRYQIGCQEIERVDYIERLIPLFDEVYLKALEKDPNLSKNIKLYMRDDAEPNAFATGRNTICLTRGLLNLSDNEIKAIFAHEFAHLSNKDTDLILLVTVGNFIVLIFFVIIRFIFRTIGFIFAIINRSLGVYLATLLIDFIYVGIFNLWTWFGNVLVLHSSRKHEFEADKFAYNLGYGNDLAMALDNLNNYSGDTAKGLFATLRSSHPKIDARISKLQQLGATYRRYN